MSEKDYAVGLCDLKGYITIKMKFYPSVCIYMSELMMRNKLLLLLPLLMIVIIITIIKLLYLKRRDLYEFSA